MVLGGRCLKIRDVCMDFEPNFKVHILVYVHPKSIILGQMANLNMIFYVVVSVHSATRHNIHMYPHNTTQLKLNLLNSDTKGSKTSMWTKIGWEWVLGIHTALKYMMFVWIYEKSVNEIRMKSSALKRFPLILQRPSRYTI